MKDVITEIIDVRELLSLACSGRAVNVALFEFLKIKGLENEADDFVKIFLGKLGEKEAMVLTREIVKEVTTNKGKMPKENEA